MDQSCSAADCVAGSFCNQQDICQAEAAAGAECADGFFTCVSGYVCDLGPDFTPGTCVKVPGSGETCDPAFGGEFVDGRLSCSQSTDYCDKTSNTCVSRIAVDGSCAGDLEDACVNYSECISGVCTASPGAGESCDVELGPDCLGNLDCVSGMCVLEPADPACTL